MKILPKTYSSVEEMVRDIASPEFADQFERHLADRELATALTVLRCREEVTQAELAKRMECGQAKVSKMEGSADADLNLGDVVKYAASLSRSVHLAILPGHADGNARILYHVDAIKRELGELSGGDGQGVEALAIEHARRVLGLVEDSLGRLPSRAENGHGSLSVEVQGESRERLSGGPSRRSRVRKKATRGREA